MSELDILNLGTQAIEGSDQEYEAPSEFRRPPEITPKGERTTIILAREIKEENLYPLTDFQTREKIPGFSANVQFKIQGGKQDGMTFFVFLDTRKKRDRAGNDIQDLLRASGSEDRLVTQNDYKEAVLSLEPTPIQVKLGWQVEKCQVCAAVTAKLKDFPERADGTLAHVTECPDCGEQIGVRPKVMMIFVGR